MNANPLPRELPDPDSLDTPDHPDWANHPHYDLIVADKLTTAYQLIDEDFRRAARLALDCLDMELCDCQRLRATYIVARGFAALEREDEAVGWIDRALDLTLLVPEHPSFIDLLDLRFHCNVCRLEFGAASDDMAEAAARRRALPQPWDEALVTKLLATLCSRAQMLFYLSDPDGMQMLLREARDLLPLAGDGAALRVADIELTQALLARQLGKAAEAAPIALRAAMTFESLSKPQSALRAYVLLASAYLDVAETTPPSRDQDHFFAVAAAHLKTARKLARACNDNNGAPLITLEHVRLDRLRGRWRDRVPVIERVITKARDENNTMLLVQALTTLGDEHRKLGNPQLAKRAYREALAALGNHEITMLAAPIHKGLEMLR